MTIKEITEYEKENINTIRLYKEGIFYKAYEKSAYAFIMQIHPYSVKAKYFKMIGEAVVSIGFPASALNKFTDKIEVNEEGNKFIVIKCNEVDNEMFEQWKLSISNKELAVNNEELPPIVPPNAVKVIEMIKAYPLESKSPMESMMFLSEIKTMMNH